ncbi:hypothetical protein C8Q73DRAFT_685383 [Cubamyces lactineus]|nr:hypothetical protein C8Q73DRAFT_685383 [Cubamyces lactineus]
MYACKRSPYSTNATLWPSNHSSASRHCMHSALVQANILGTLCIDFQGDISSYGRVPCPSDYNPGKFRKTATPNGQSVVVVLDFGATCFMPLPFIEVALKKDRDDFRRSLIEKIEYPRERWEGVEALLSVSGQLVQYGEKPIALPLGVSSNAS